MTLDQLDDLASGLERKWGIDRLPRLMPLAWRSKFDALKAQLDRTIAASMDTTEAAAALAKAWRMMDTKATEQGSFPLPPACFSVKVDDHIIEIAQDQMHATALIWWAKNEGRTTAVWTLEEVATVLRLHGVAHAAKEVWPGALVSAMPAEFRPGKRKANLGDDEIPFGGDAEVAA
jgi:hypothetical protein